ncbi:hypothetical protein HOLleu_04483 [Holothuria leucospilota]|uniref:Uncharacterized protein n=1 Tax=Holothuria leucospilota TaxID=206669 RepID=A0A9Q1HME3_HOLLE|nr:hypothetical protein HOLleu_04483 [Holothuria leucospilota]
MCEHRQYLELGKSGIISCSFQEGFFGVFWFNTTNYRSEEPILHFTQSSKTGVGYTSGEYDVLENGSLVIINVTFQHETSFTVAYFQSQRDAALYYDVKVVVLGR